MTKKYLGLIVIGIICLLALAEVIYAATQTADITVTVTCRKLSVSVSPSSYAFGNVNEGVGTVATSAITVTNDGNATETFQLMLADPAGWTGDLTGTPAEDHYKLGGVIRATTDAAPVAGDFTDSEDYISTSYVSASSTVFAKTGDTSNGASVAAAAARKLWFYFFAPSYSTVGTEQSITVTVKAIAAS